MHIDHAELTRATRAFTTEGHDLAVLVDQLLGRIDQLGDVYGEDDSGRQAKQAFDRAREDVAWYAGALCDAYGTIAANLALMNANVETANWNGIAALPAVDLTTVPRFGA